MPWTMGAFTVAALGMVGIAPIAGFVSKWYLLQGSAAAIGWAGIAVLSLSSLLNATYFFPIITRAFFRPWREEDAPAPGDEGHGAHAHPADGPAAEHSTGRHGEAPPAMLAPILLLAVLCLVVGFWPQLPLNLVLRLVGDL